MPLVSGLARSFGDNMVKVGIPRALLYYEYFPMWAAFFEELGAEVVVSPLTTKAAVAAGSSLVVADTCLPVKIFLGHVLSLIGRCDYIFIPVIRSMRRKIYNCAKLLGLPDMTRAVMTKSPPILDMEIDINRGERSVSQAVNRLGRHFTQSAARIRRANMKARQTYLDYHQLMSSHGLTPPQAIPRISSLSADEPPGSAGPQANSHQAASTQATIALIGHPYLLYDEYVNHRLIHRLEQANSRVLTAEMLNAGNLESASARLAGVAYWACGDEVVGAGEHYLQNGADGVIGVMTFGCGPDSLLMDMVRHRAARLRTTPFMSLTLEEHTAETGVITRLEAFLDMINRKKRGR